MKNKAGNNTSQLAVCHLPALIRVHLRGLFLGTTIFAASLLWAGAAEAAPAIQVMTPQTGPVGTLVAIVGSGFGATQGTSTVTFNGEPVTWVSWSATNLQVQVPGGAASGNVIVTVGGKASNAKSFTVTPSPVITGLSPTSGSVNATITITGSNFTAGGTQTPQVVFNPQLFASPASSTDTSISVAVPAGATTGDLLVSVGGGYSNSILFTVTSSDPSISSLTPDAAVVGTSVTITGTNFGTSQGTSSVTFNGTAATPTSWSPTSIKVPVPSGATTGNVLVTVGGVASNPYGFEVGIAGPSITSISPTSGAVGTSVTIKGTGFGSTQGSNTVNFNGVSGVPTSWSATQIKVPVPTGATTGSVVVTASGTVSNAVNFTVPGTGPSVSTLSPSSGPVETSVVLTGTNFGSTQGASTVTFNGILATATGWSPTSIVATVPYGATNGSVVVTVDGNSSSGISFTVAPSVTSLSPTSGPGGTPVTITGTSFGSSQGTSTVTFNGALAAPTSWGASSITVPVPSGATTGNVVVTVGGVASNGLNFAVTPSITSISPVSAPVGNSVTISGSNFGPNQGSSTVTFGGIPATTTSWSPTSIVATVPAGATTGNVVVTVSGLASNGTEFTVATLTSLAITPQNPAISIGSTQQFIATGTYSDNSQQNLTAGANWTSSTLSVAAINGSGLATALGNGQTTIQVSVGSIQSTTVLSVAGFALTGSLNAARLGHTATLLNNGTVLIVGGYEVVNGQEQSLASAELYNPSTGTFTTTGSLNTARGNFTATLLNDGTVLVAGGYDSSFNLTATAEIYNPTTGVFTPTANMGAARANHSATLLGNGMVLIAGSFDDSANGYAGAALASAELYNPATGAFTPTGSLPNPLGYLTATLLNDGTVLIVGGESPGPSFTNDCELYNPSTGAFIATGSMVSPITLTEYTATLLNNGMVLVAGGVNPANGQVAATAELYNPSTMAFTLTGNMNFARALHGATLLSNGMVLIEGGGPGTLTSAELYAPLSGTFSVTGSLNVGRAEHSSTLLSNGSVLVAGGFGASSVLTSAELYGPATMVPANLVSISVSPVNPSISPGAFQTFTATGTFSDGSTQTLSSETWSSSNSTIATITNDSTDRGVVFGLTTGAATLSACTGSLCGSTTVTVSPASPTIAGLAPNAALPGASVSITGTNFGTVQGTSTVTFNGTVAIATSWSATSIVATVPVGATTGNVVVIVSGVASNGVSFTVPTLLSISVSPQSVFIPPGTTEQYMATGTYSDNSTQDVTSLAAWSSSASSIATITNSGLASGVGQGQTTIQAAIGAIFGTSSLTVSNPSFSTTENLNTARRSASSVVLESGLILVYGGSLSTGYSAASSELYNASSGTFTAGPSLNTARATPTTTLMNDGTVLVTGGTTNAGANVASTEIYNPQTGMFAAGASMNTARANHSATLLPNGMVLLVGGTDNNYNVLSTAELYNPYTQNFTFTGNLTKPRTGHTAVLLNDGTVLILGGVDDTDTLIPAAEIYTPSTGTFSAVGSLATPRQYFSATLLNTGQVVVVGGFDVNASPVSNTELYNPSTQTFTATGQLATARYLHSASLLNNGSVLIAGGNGAEGVIATAELYNPSTGTFVPAGSMTTPVVSATAAVLSSGQVLIAGGSSSSGVQTVAELYQPTTFVPGGLTSITISPVGPTIPLGGFQRFVATGSLANNSSQTLASATWSSSNPSIATVANDVSNTGSALAVAPGSTTLSACTGSVCGSVNVMIGQPVVSWITLTPAGTVQLQQGSSVQFYATGVSSNGISEDISSVAQWTSSNPSVATVSSAGLVQAISSGVANIIVTAGGITGTSSVSVPYLPSIGSLIPNSGSAGTTVQISGAHFGTLQGSVSFSGVSASVSSWGDQSIEVTVPGGAVSGPVVVTSNSGLQSMGFSFAVQLPTISSLSPNSGAPGTLVTIAGSNFGSSQGTGTVSFNGQLATISNWSSTSISAVVPNFAASGNVIVTAFDAASNGIPFSVQQSSTPMISSVSPSTGALGSTVTISGSGFGPAQDTSLVTFAGMSATPCSSCWSNTQISVLVPVSALSGPIVVTVGGVSSNAFDFTVSSPAIQITSPAPGTIVAPGQSLSVTVASPTGITITQAAVAGDTAWGFSNTATSLPAQLTISIPASTSEGNHPLTAFASTPQGFLQSSPVLVDVERADLPKALALDPGTIMLSSPGQTLPLSLVGTFSDGTTLDLTNSSNVTYSSSVQTIATVDNNGVVTAQGSGTTQVSALYQSAGQYVMAFVDVTVGTFPLTFSSGSLVFQSQTVGTNSNPQQLTLTNSGSNPVSILQISSSGDFSESNNCVASSPLEPGNSCYISVVFSATAPGPDSGTLNIFTDQNTVPAAIVLSGTGTN